MKKEFLFLLLFLFLFLGCFAQDTLFFDKNWKASKKSNAAFYRVQKKQDSLWLRTDYFKPNNQVQMQGHLASLDPELQQGEFKWYYQNGILKHRGSFYKGKETGLHQWYSETGQLESSENYKEGKLNGDMTSFFPNGEKSMETKYKDGVQEGHTIFFYENGKKKAEGMFASGEESGVWTNWDENGKELASIEFKTTYYFKEEGLSLKLPNTYWFLNAADSSKKPIEFIYKRSPVKNSKGGLVIPAITLFTEDATEYNNDVVSFSILKEKPFQENSNLKIEMYFSSMNKNWPLHIKNAVGCRAKYTERGEEHIFYMIYVINKNKGIQLYMDINSELAQTYESEFIKTIDSLRVDE